MITPELGSPTFDPLTLAPALWLEATVGTLFQDTAGTTPVTAAGQSIARWNDKSGNGRNLTQSTAANQPTYQVGHVSFDGVSDTLRLAFTLVQPCSYAIVCRYADVANSTIIDGFGGNIGRLYMSGASLVMYAGAALAAATLTAATWQVVTMGWSGANSTGKLNNGSVVTGDAGTTAPNGITLGTFGDGASTPADVDLAEVLVFPSLLSSAQQSAVAIYLMNKYGVA